jgi:hypothetical protein
VLAFMTYKLIRSAEGQWRSVNGPHLVALVALVALVRAGATFCDGLLVYRTEPGAAA